MLAGIVRLGRRPKLRIIGLLVFVDLFVLAVILVSLSSSLEQYRERAEITSRNLNRLVAQTFTDEIGSIDLILRTVMDEMAYRQLISQPDPAILHDIFDRQMQRHPIADAIRMADAEGHLLAGSDEIPPNISVAEREYFQQLKSNPSLGLVISKPLVSSVTGKPILIFARAVLDAKGQFAGTIAAPVSIDWFRQKFDSLEVGPHGAVVMRGNASRDFDLLVRYPEAGFVGQTKVSDTFRATITADPRSGTYEAKAGGDDVRRIFSYQAVGDYPLITLVGLARQDFMGHWEREAVKLGVLGAVFVLLTGLGGFVLLSTWRTLELRTEELERSNADLEQFAYAASHDLQTPLRNIASYTQLLERRYRGKLGEDAEEFLDFIVGNAKKLSMMIRDLLDFSRASTAGDRLSVVDLSIVVAEVLGRLQQNLDSVGAQVQVGDLPKVRGEIVWLESLTQNLIENAIRYRHPDRSLKLTITAMREGAKQWRVSIADNGIGIDPAYHEKVFTMFYRLNPASHPEGTGIGLPLCRRLVSRFGGKLWLESEPGVGTTLHFTMDAAPTHPLE
jgi:signal transduction histidine kinase